MEITIVEEDAGHKADDAERSIRAIIERNELCSMATVREHAEAHINTAFYAHDEDLRLYVLTPPDTQHGTNLAENPSVAVDIHDAGQEWTDEKRGLQLFGTAHRLTGRDRAPAFERYRECFPALDQFASTVDDLDGLDSSFYRIVPDRIRLFDEPAFGTEVWIDVDVWYPDE